MHLYLLVLTISDFGSWPCTIKRHFVPLFQTFKFFFLKTNKEKKKPKTNKKEKCGIFSKFGMYLERWFFAPGMFFFQNCFEIQELAVLNVNDSLGRGMAWLVSIRHMHPDELQSRIA